MFADSEFRFPRKALVSDCFDIMPPHQALAIARAGVAEHAGRTVHAQRAREQGGYGGLLADTHGRWSYPR